MLFQFGPLTFQVAPFNTHEIARDGRTDFAAKDVVGAEPPLEFVGEGGNTLQLSCRLFPEKLGGLDELALLEQMRAAGLPQHLMRGDGTPVGWFVIEGASERSTYLDGHGVGRVVEVTISLRRAPKPAAASFFSLLTGWFR
jgi:Phage protein U